MSEPFLPIDSLPAPTAVGYDRPAGDHRQSRSAVLARQGAVATSHPLAAAAGVSVLRRGGTAVDAAIAANAMLGVVEPMSCGIGGDLFAICWNASDATLHGLNASGRSPQGLDRSAMEARHNGPIPTHGPLSWSVPGCVDGWRRLQERFGRLSLGDLLEASIRTARDGFPVSEIIAQSWKNAASELAEWDHNRAVFLVNGKAPSYGQVVRNEQLADVYEHLARNGHHSFYEGEISERVERFNLDLGGFIRRSDLIEHRSNWVDPVSTQYRGNTVWQLPPNGQGLAVLQMLNMLEEVPVGELEQHGADYLHYLIEAKKLAFEDRSVFYADPDFHELPVSALISKEYANERRKLIDPSRAMRKPTHGDPRLRDGDTVYVAAVDGDGNCCSLIQSIFHGFGSMVSAGDLGFMMQNRGCLFSMNPAHLNSLEPGKRPFNTIIPGFVTRDGTPRFCFGVMGGDMQPQGQVQLLTNIIDHGMNVQSAGDAPRVRHFGSSSPTGMSCDSGGGRVAVESGIRPEVLDELARRGHRLCRAPGTFGGYQGILIDQESGVLHAGSDPRKDGAAVGY